MTTTENTTGTRFVTSADGTPIAYSVTGTGPALVLVDGALCSRAWGPLTPLAAQLADHFTVHTYDRRGRNESGDAGDYHRDKETQDLAAVIDAAAGSAYVYGVSSGAVLVLRSVPAIPGIRAVAVYEAPVVIEGDGIPATYVPRLEALAAEGRNADILELFNTEIIGMPAEFVEPMKAMPMWSLMEAGAATLVHDARVMGGCQDGTGLDAELVAALSATTVPVLVMDGAASPSSMRTGADAIAAHLPHGSRRTLDGQTHEAEPVVVSAALVAHFAH